MKNQLSDLNNHLFAQLERLGDESLKDEKLRTEIERGKSVSMVAQNIINNARLILDAHIAGAEWRIKSLPMIGAVCESDDPKK